MGLPSGIVPCGGPFCMEPGIREVLMGAASEAVSYAKNFGDVPVLIIVLFIFIALLIWLIKQMASISKTVKDLENKVDGKNAEQDKQIAFLQQHYVTKEDMFQQFGGWRTEIAKISDQVTKMSDIFSGQILHLTELITKER